MQCVSGGATDPPDSHRSPSLTAPNGNRNDDHTQHNEDHDQFDDDLIIMVIMINLIYFLFIEQTDQIPSLTTLKCQP